MAKRDELLKELHDLLKKYDAEITSDDHWTGYPECGRDVRMTIEFNDGCEDIDLGTWIDSEGHGGIEV